jgi:TubC N-terminal docking domain
MTAVVRDLLRQVTKAGGTVQLAGDALRLLAPEPLPDDLRARMRQHKAEIVALLGS